MLKREAESAALPEVRDRAAALLRAKDARGPWLDEAVQAARALRFMGTAQSRECLEELARGAENLPATGAAKRELEREAFMLR